MPLKDLVCSTVDLARVAQEAPPHHIPYIREAARVLDGSHEVWDGLRSLAPNPHGGVRSRVTTEQLQAALRFGLVEEVPPGRVKVVCTFFTVPKSDGIHSRPILDCRPINALMNVRSVMGDRGGPDFRILPPLECARMLASVDRDPALCVSDARSWFPSFRWGGPLPGWHAFKVGAGQACRWFMHRAPSQGNCILPWVAMVTMSAIARAPAVDAPFAAWRRSRVAVVYDDVLHVGERSSLPSRVRGFRNRLVRAGGVLADEKADEELACTRATFCGIEFDTSLGVGKVRWRLKDSFTLKAPALLRDTGTDGDVAAGLICWFTWATGRPLAPYSATVHGQYSDAEREGAAMSIERNEWRSFAVRPQDPPLREELEVVFTDGSPWGVGLVGDRGEVSVPHSGTYQGSQQDAEWGALAMAMDVYGVHMEGPPLLVATDNLGILYSVLAGHTTSTAGSVLLKRASTSLRRPIYIAFVPSERNVADGPSRGSSGAPITASLRKEMMDIATPALWTFVRRCVP